MQVLKLLAANSSKKIVNKTFKAYRSSSLQTLNSDYTKQTAAYRLRKNRNNIKSKLKLYIMILVNDAKYTSKITLDK